MKEKVNRFQRLEYFPLLSVFRKPTVELKRFERLEVDGHKIQLKITEAVKKGYVVCPECHRNNPKESLYCIYCSHIFENIAKEEKEVEIKPWEIKCQGCSRIVARAQKFCLYCGFRLAPTEKEEVSTEISTLSREENLLREGEVVTLNVDGNIYRSTDRCIPADVRELILKIKREGYSKEMVDAWITERDKQRELARQEKLQEIEHRQFILRLQLGLIFGGIILLIVLFILNPEAAFQFLWITAIIFGIWLRCRYWRWWWWRDF